MNLPKLLFVYDHKYEDRWMDGLWAALELLKEDFEITKENINGDNCQGWSPKGYDFLLAWGGFHSRPDTVGQHHLVKDFNIKSGLCIGGNAFPPTGADNYDVLFYETKWYRPQINFHKNIVHAFGVNTQIYNKESFPTMDNLAFATPVVWDYLGVGSFSSWKRWDKFNDKKGMRLILGEYQSQNEQESLAIVRSCMQNGVFVGNMVHPLDLANMYRWARTVYIPADINGGGERAVLEAKACGCRVEVEEDNPKLKELVEGPIWDEKYYAEQVKKGILSVL